MAPTTDALLPAIKTPRDLDLPGRILRSMLSHLDRVNPFLAASQPVDLEFDAIDREGQVAAFLAMRAVMEPYENRHRLESWACRYRARAFEDGLQQIADAFARAAEGIASICEGRAPFKLKAAPVTAAEEPQSIPGNAPAAPQTPLSERPQPVKTEKPQPLRVVRKQG